jgi:hypothetical protein
MDRGDLQRLTKDELIDLVLRIQRPEKTSRTSSRPPSTDRKERRDKAKPGGAKPGHEGHSRAMSEDADRVVDHYSDQCLCCRASLPGDLSTTTVCQHDRIELPETKPMIERALSHQASKGVPFSLSERGQASKCLISLGAGAPDKNSLTSKSDSRDNAVELHLPSSSHDLIGLDHGILPAPVAKVGTVTQSTRPPPARSPKVNNPREGRLFGPTR